MSVQQKPENVQRAESRETPSAAELEAKITALQVQLRKTPGVAERVALQDQINALERQLEKLA